MLVRVPLLAALGALFFLVPAFAQEAPAPPVAVPTPTPFKAARYDLINAAANGDLNRVQLILNAYPEYINGNDSQTPLSEAVNNGQVEVERYLLEHGANPNSGSWNITPLGQALIRYDDKWRSLADALVAKGADVNATDGSGQPLLQQLLQYGLSEQKERISWLLSHGANIYAPARDTTSILDAFAQYNNPGIIQMVFDKADVKHRDEVGQTPLFSAVRADKLDLVRSLLERGADANAQNAFGDTPLHVAARGDGRGTPDINLLKLLLNSKANPNLSNARGDLPLHLALRRDVSLDRTFNAQDGNYPPLPDPNTTPRGLQLVPLINQTDINARDGGGLSPLLLSIIERDPDSRDLIHDRNPKKDSTTALFDAVAGGDTTQLTQILTAKPYLTFFRLSDGSTPLHIAALWGTLGCATELVKRGADVNARDVRGFTPLHYAVRNPTGRFARRALNITTFLLGKGANPNLATPSGDAPLHLAARAANSEIINLLLGKGARLDARGIGGETPLFILTNQGTSRELYDALLAKGANPNARSVSGVALDPYGFGYATTPQIFATFTPSATNNQGPTTPLHRAVLAGRRDLTTDLLAKGADIEARDGEGHTPLAVAVISANYNGNGNGNGNGSSGGDLISLLISKGANPNVTIERQDLLSYAVDRGNVEAVRALLNSHKIPLSSKERRDSPLLKAVSNNRVDLVRVLLDAGVDPNETDQNGRSALDSAYSDELKKLLTDRIAALQATKAGDANTKAPVN